MTGIEYRIIVRGRKDGKRPKYLAYLVDSGRENADFWGNTPDELVADLMIPVETFAEKMGVSVDDLWEKQQEYKGTITLDL